MIILEKELFSSGGGFDHLLIRLENKHIIAIHLPFMDVEYSQKEYESIDEYLDDKVFGFGYEWKYANYDDRFINLFDIFSKTINK
jgi:hypothetical protein